MISKNDLLNAYEIYLSKNEELFVLMDDSETAYHFSKETLTWEKIAREYSWKVWNEAISGEKADEIMMDWIKEQMVHKQRLNTAIEFATKKHSGQFRKSTAIPYILHPLEVLQILYSMRADTNVMIAGVLHDTVEDTDTTLDEIRELFGNDVTELVASNSEDKSKTWDERKQHTIDDLAGANKRVKMLIMADKLSNIRSIAHDYKNIGDELWKRFNAPKKKQAWYYDGILDAIYDMHNDVNCRDVYWEITGLFKDVFVRYYLDNENNVLYQESETGLIFYLKKGDPRWYSFTEELGHRIAKDLLTVKDGEKRYYKMNSVPEGAISISRREAEQLEDIWNMVFSEKSPDGRPN